MSASFYWEPVVPRRGSPLGHGTSSEVDALKRTFPSGEISSLEVEKLRAMHTVTGLEESLWSYIADTLERLQANGSLPVAINVWVEY